MMEADVDMSGRLPPQVAGSCHKDNPDCRCGQLVLLVKTAEEKAPGYARLTTSELFEGTTKVFGMVEFAETGSDDTDDMDSGDVVEFTADGKAGSLKEIEGQYC